ncbi:PAS domain-containing sensor histidine kinase [Paraliomyxa miuraensis]|uniref:PAS domain-containing sensor histidine kinase n=1 Tax=Paraliomyxa miuraensis TaxID=376150 RepID=UPI002259BFE3|nr:PAS domain-containing sensor histidine kinase [Paraliomyxa miuraensis]MCX4240770.1 PAS domain-containing sensor histidine kinase [Paraliomyxa miuraensis]
MTPTPVDVDLLHEALRQAPGYIIITDAQMRIIYVSRVAMGYKREDVLGRRHGEFVSAEQRRKLEQVFERARATGQAQHYETFLDAPDGQRYYYSNQISSYEVADGSGGGMISIMTDVTRQRAAEARAEALYQELREASHRAGMAEVATRVLHDVGHLLNGVYASSEALATELEGSRLHLLERTVAMLDEHEGGLAELITDEPRGRKLPVLLTALIRELRLERERMRAMSARIRQLVERMRSFIASQHRIARLGELAGPTEPRGLVRQALSLFELELEFRVIEIELTLDDVGKVVLDTKATLMVLECLIRNAIAALETSERRRVLSIRLRVEADAIHFDVQDNGRGLDPEELAGLFARNEPSTARSGHGFGLHTSAIAAQTMNGTLSAHSEGLGHGACFRLSLPRISP